MITESEIEVMLKRRDELFDSLNIPYGCKNKWKRFLKLNESKDPVWKEVGELNKKIMDYYGQTLIVPNKKEGKDVCFSCKKEIKGTHHMEESSPECMKCYHERIINDMYIV